jgi:hypothetical protein
MANMDRPQDPDAVYGPANPNISGELSAEEQLHQERMKRVAYEETLKSQNIPLPTPWDQASEEQIAEDLQQRWYSDPEGFAKEQARGIKQFFEAQKRGPQSETADQGGEVVYITEARKFQERLQRGRK